MKKRKELNALVSNGKLGKRTKKSSGSGSAHELLRHDSETSDIEDFSILQPRSSCKKGGSPLRLCTACLPLCLFVLVTACVVASATLLWLHLGLREDLDLLRNHLQKVEAGNKNTPEALHTIHSQLKDLDNNVSSIGIELKKVTSDITTLSAQTQKLQKTTEDMKASIAAAPEIFQVPKDLSSLSQSVANIGSKITALESTVKELKDQQMNSQTTAQSLTSDFESVKSSVQDLWNNSQSCHECRQTIADTKQNIQKVSESVERLNFTFLPQIQLLNEVPAQLEVMNKSLIWLIKDAHHHHEQLNLLDSNITTLAAHVNSFNTGVLEGNATFNMQQFTTYINTQLKKQMEETVLTTLTDILNDSVPVGSNVTWQRLLQQSHSLVVLYVNLLKQLNVSSSVNTFSEDNATSIISLILNKTLSEILLKHDTRVQILYESVENITQKCDEIQKSFDSTRNQLDTAVRHISQLEQQISISNLSHQETSIPYYSQMSTTQTPQSRTSQDVTNPTKKRRRSYKLTDPL